MSISGDVQSGLVKNVGQDTRVNVSGDNTSRDNLKNLELQASGDLALNTSYDAGTETYTADFSVTTSNVTDTRVDVENNDGLGNTSNTDFEPTSVGFHTDAFDVDPSPPNGGSDTLVDLAGTATTETFQSTSHAQTDEIRSNGAAIIDVRNNADNEWESLKFDIGITDAGQIASNQSTMNVTAEDGSDNITTQSNIFDASTRVQTDTLRSKNGQTMSARDSAGADAVTFDSSILKANSHVSSDELRSASNATMAVRDSSGSDIVEMDCSQFTANTRINSGIIRPKSGSSITIEAQGGGGSTVESIDQINSATGPSIDMSTAGEIDFGAVIALADNLFNAVILMDEGENVLYSKNVDTANVANNSTGGVFTIPLTISASSSSQSMLVFSEPVRETAQTDQAYTSFGYQSGISEVEVRVRDISDQDSDGSAEVSPANGVIAMGAIVF